MTEPDAIETQAHTRSRVPSCGGCCTTNPMYLRAPTQHSSQPAAQDISAQNPSSFPKFCLGQPHPNTSRGDTHFGTHLLGIGIAPVLTMATNMSDPGWDQSFWASSPDWYRLTLKFQETIMGITPSSVMALLSPFLIVHYFSEPVRVRRNWLLWAKVVSLRRGPLYARGSRPDLFIR